MQEFERQQERDDVEKEEEARRPRRSPPVINEVRNKSVNTLSLTHNLIYDALFTFFGVVSTKGRYIEVFPGLLGVRLEVGQGHLIGPIGHEIFSCRHRVLLSSREKTTV
jgi:hypothetical protein